MTALQELNNLITKEYTIEVNLLKTSILDSYIEGELDKSYDYRPYKTIKRSSPKSIKQDLRSTLNFLMKDIVEYGSLEKYYKESFEDTDDSIVILMQQNGDREKPSDEEIKLWKSGEYDLYNSYYRFDVIINGARVGLKLLNKLIGACNLD